MKTIQLFVLWDEKDGDHTSKIYLDYQSAKIGLSENFTRYWIDNGKAKVRQVDGVSYFQEMA